MRAPTPPAGVLALVLALAGTSCSDPAAPAAAALIEEGLVLSEAIETTSEQIVYVSLQAGTVAGGVSATATNVATGASIEAPMEDGGFGPVALPAVAGDSIQVTTRDRQGSFRHFGGAVAMSRPPVVVRTGPGRGATDVSLNSIIIVVFSEPMDEETVTWRAIELTLDEGLVPIEVALSADGLQAEVRAGGLLPSREYTLVVGTEVQDRHGIHLEREYRSTFRTAAAQTTFTAVTAGSDHTCGLTDSGTVYCWGANGNGQLGVGDRAPRSAPVRVDGRFVSFEADGSRTCALADGGILSCWGSLGFGLLSPDREDYTRPEPLFSPDGAAGGVTFLSMAVGDRLVCGLDALGSAHCRGTYLLRDGSWLVFSDTRDDETHSLTEVLDGTTFRHLALGGQHGCGLLNSGDTHCWGLNRHGELGDGTLSPSIYIDPNDTLVFTAPAVASDRTFSAIVSGGNHSCGLADGHAYCWGRNQYGKLGTGDLADSNVPVSVSGAIPFATIDAGEEHTCGVTSAGDAYCWGANFYGQLGDGTLLDRESPALVLGGLTWDSIAVGDRHTCGRTIDGLVYCWGRNEAGQLGDGRREDQAAPVRVASP